MAILRVRDEKGNVYDVPVVKGEPGYTPQKDIDYFDGKDGMSITVVSVSESTEDGGDNVVTFNDGNTLTVKNGRTPEKGTDYFTEGDIEAVVKKITPSKIGAAESDHGHSASDIDSGTLPVARGGTGATTASTAREKLGFTGGITTAITKNFNVSRAIVSNAEGKLASSAVTATEIGYLDGVTSGIQEQFDKIKDQLDKKVEKCIEVTTKGANLDDYVDEGWYYFGSSYTPVNIPSGTNGFLHVVRRKTSSIIIIKQFWYRMGNTNTDHNCYMRNYYSGDSAWTNWTRFITEKDAYQKTKLWTNANLSNGFNAQTISLSLSGYDGVEILYYVDSSTNVYQNTGTILKGINGVMWYVTAESGHRIHREFTATDSGVKFEKATNYNGSVSVEKLCIPYIIYGIKGIS